MFYTIEISDDLNHKFFGLLIVTVTNQNDEPNSCPTNAALTRDRIHLELFKNRYNLVSKWILSTGVNLALIPFKHDTINISHF